MVEGGIPPQRLCAVSATVAKCQKDEITEADLRSPLRDQYSLIYRVIHRVARLTTKTSPATVRTVPIEI